MAGLPMTGPRTGARPTGIRPTAGRRAGRPRPTLASWRGAGAPRIIAFTLLALGGLGLVGFGAGAGIQVMPRKFTATQRQQITDWEFGKRWRDLTAGAIFPASVSYPAPRGAER